MVVTLFFVSIMVFVIMELPPGDYADRYAFRKYSGTGVTITQPCSRCGMDSWASEGTRIFSNCSGVGMRSGSFSGTSMRTGPSSKAGHSGAGSAAFCASIIAQEAALEALLRGWDAVVKMRDQYHRRRDLVVRRFNEAGLKCHSPRGSFYTFPDITPTGLTEKQFAVGLLEKEKVAVVPGTAFGVNGTGHVRGCFATGYEQLIVACDRIDRFVQGIKS